MKLSKRMITLAILTVIALPLLGSVNEALAENMLMNSDFESGDFSGWEIFGLNANSSATIGTPDNGPAAPGIYHAFLANEGQALNLTLKQSTEAGSASEGPVDYSFDLKLGEAAASGVFFVEIFAEQAGGGVIGTSGVLGNFTPADWTTYTGTIMAPAGTNFLTIQLSAITGAVEGAISTMYVDNVSLDQGTVAEEATSLDGVKALYR
nr:hypothetical protein [Candidatus Krumholzibacteria bacterium]